MKKIILLLYFFTFTVSYGKELENCEWNNKSGKPCLTIFKAFKVHARSKNSLLFQPYFLSQ